MPSIQVWGSGILAIAFTASVASARECKSYMFNVDLTLAPLGMAKGDFLDSSAWDHSRCLRVWSGVKAAYLSRRSELAGAARAAERKAFSAYQTALTCRGETCPAATEASKRARAYEAEASARLSEAGSAYDNIGPCVCSSWKESNPAGADRNTKQDSASSTTRQNDGTRLQRPREANDQSNQKRAATSAETAQKLKADTARLRAQREAEEQRIRSTYQNLASREEALAQQRREYEARQAALDARYAAETQRRGVDDSKVSNPDGTGAALIDPFGGGGAPARTTRPEPQLVDPFGGNPGNSSRASTSEVVNPFDGPERSYSPVSKSELDRGKSVAVASIHAGIAHLDRQLEAASERLGPNQFAKFKASATQTRQALEGIDHLLTAIDYGQLVIDLHHADTPAERKRAAGELGFKFVTDAATLGIERVAPRLFGRAAALLGGPMTVVAEVFTPETISRDFSEVIYDRSGASSLADKQEALRQLWVAYEKVGRMSWSAADRAHLLEATDSVYREARQP